MATKEIQREDFVQDDLTPYRGSWVAVRDGRVVANAVEPVQFLNNPAVQEGDTIVLVPTEGAGLYYY